MFNFDLLDDVLFDFSDTRHEELTDALLGNRLHDLGASVEYSFLSKQPGNDSLPPADQFIHQNMKALTRALLINNFSENRNDLGLSPYPIEFFRPPIQIDELEDNRWLAFRKRLQAAARSVVGETFSYQLTGSFDEMQNNAIDHSEFSMSTLVGYAFEESEFSFVVADAGQGVLASLKQNPEFESLTNSTDALKFATQDGVTRFGEPGRGNGFRQMLSNLEFAGCFIRLRSGNAKLEMQDSSISLGEAADYQGFFCNLKFNA